MSTAHWFAQILSLGNTTPFFLLCYAENRINELINIVGRVSTLRFKKAGLMVSRTEKMKSSKHIVCSYLTDQPTLFMLISIIP